MDSTMELIADVPGWRPRAREAHKGDFGRIFVIAGSRGMSGAAVLCGSAALRGGAGLVTVACPESVWPIVAAGNPCLMTFPLPESQQGISPLAVEWLTNFPPRADVVAIGPGLGTNASIQEVVNVIVRSARIPVVVDADALNVLDVEASLGHHEGPRVLTPHPGEFARLLGSTTAEVQARREEWTIEFARKFDVVLVLKGAGTLVCDGRRLYRNTTGNPGMATAGSGDVLTGLIAALLGQGWSPFDAARLAVYLHGGAGDLARCQLGEASLTAQDLLDFLPKAFISWEEAHSQKGS